MTRSIKSGIWAATGLVLLTAALIIFLSVVQEKRDVQIHGQEIASAVAGSLQEQASSAIRDITNGLFGAEAGIRSNGGIGPLGQERLSELLSREFTDNANIVDILVMTPDGTVRAHTNRQVQLNASYSNSAIVEHFGRSPDRKPLVLPPLFGPAYKRWLLPISVRIDGPGGAFDGVIVALIDVRYFENVYSRLRRRDGWQYTLASAGGVVVAHYPPLDESQPVLSGVLVHAKDVRRNKFMPHPEGKQLSGTGMEGAFLGAHPVTGLPFIYSVRPLHSHPLVMVVGIDENEHLAKWRLHTAQKVLGWVVFAFVTIMAAWLLMRAISRTERATELVRAVMTCAGDGILIFRQDQIAAANPAGVVMFGASSEQELTSLTRQHLSPERQATGQLSGHYWEAMCREAAGKGAHQFEWAARRIGASPFPAEVTLTTFAVDGETYCLGIFRDISERKHQAAVLQQLNATLESRVAQRSEEVMAQYRKLKAASEELAKVNYFIAHDLRAPVRQIAGFAELLLREADFARLSQMQKSVVVRIASCVKNCDSRIEALLKFGQTSGQPIKGREVDLSSMAGEIVDALRAGERGRQVEVHIEPGMRVTADPVLMRLVLENLLRNAWKFTSKTRYASIRFGSGVDDAGLHFFVQDNGAGFDLALADRLFEPFARMHSQEEFPGTGMGLANVADVIARHGGIVWPESAPGKGATFFFTVSKNIDIYSLA
jgi:signal transduction histidine kinase